MKGLQERNTQVLDGTVVINNKLIPRVIIINFIHILLAMEIIV